MERVVRLSTIAFCCNAIASSAQPTLTALNYAPYAGHVTEYEQGPWFEPGPSGSDMLWDYSSADLSLATWESEYLDPAALPFASEFPDATHFLERPHWGNLLIDQDGASLLGYKYLDPVFGIVYDLASEPLRYLPFPCTYETVWTDDGEGTYDTPDVPGPIDYTATISGEATGYGTLVLPNSTYDDVLRVDWVRTMDFDDGTLWSWSYNTYYLPGYPLPIAYFLWESVTFPGGEPLEGGLVEMVSSQVTDMAQQQAPDGLELFPNPAAETMQVHYTGTAHGRTVQVLDAMGRVVLVAPASSMRITLDVQDLPQGSYRLVSTSGNAIVTKPFVRQ